MDPIEVTLLDVAGSGGVRHWLVCTEINGVMVSAVYGQAPDSWSIEAPHGPVYGPLPEFEVRPIWSNRVAGGMIVIDTPIFGEHVLAQQVRWR